MDYRIFTISDLADDAERAIKNGSPFSALALTFACIIMYYKEKLNGFANLLRFAGLFFNKNKIYFFIYLCKKKELHRWSENILQQ